MTTRGFRKPGVTLVTSRMLGCFRDDPEGVPVDDRRPGKLAARGLNASAQRIGLVHMTYQISGTVPDPEWTRGAAGHLEAARVAADAKVRTLVVSHVSNQMDVPGVRERLITEIAEVFDGNIVWGEDLMHVPVGDPEAGRHTGQTPRVVREHLRMIRLS